jgi:hypothetical protein
MNKKMKLGKNEKKAIVDDKSTKSLKRSEEVRSLIDDYNITLKTGETPLQVVAADMIIDLPPSALENIESGVKNFLNGVCMHEIEQFEGLVLSYGNIEFCDNSGIIFEDSPYAHFFIRTEFLIYNASAGYKLCKHYCDIGVIYYYYINCCFSVSWESCKSITFTYTSSPL